MPANAQAEYACSHKTLADLTPDPRNANKGTERGQEMIANSLREYGAGRSILLDRNGRIIAGNKTAESAGTMGMKDVIVVETDGTQLVAVQRMDLDLDDPRAKQMAIADNRAGQVSLDWDIDVLKELAAEIDLAPFWSADELEAMWPQNADLLTDEDAVPDLPEEPVTKPGDLYILGRHRLLCGDSTCMADVERLMGGEKADICFTSPPYNAGSYNLTGNVQKKNKSSRYEGYSDDLSEDEYVDLLCDFTRLALLHCDLLAVNIQQLAGNKFAVLRWVGAHVDNFVDRAIWYKGHGNPAMAPSVMASRFEDIWIFSPEHRPNRAIKTADFRGTIENVVESVGASAENRTPGQHAATMPMVVCEYAVRSFSRSNARVYEPFGGTGTTAIACEKTGRAARLMEIDPRYCDVIVQRWQDATGQKAVLDGAAE